MYVGTHGGKLGLGDQNSLRSFLPNGKIAAVDPDVKRILQGRASDELNGFTRHAAHFKKGQGNALERYLTDDPLLSYPEVCNTLIQFLFRLITNTLRKYVNFFV